MSSCRFFLRPASQLLKYCHNCKDHTFLFSLLVAYISYSRQPSSWFVILKHFYCSIVFRSCYVHPLLINKPKGSCLEGGRGGMLTRKWLRKSSTGLGIWHATILEDWQKLEMSHNTHMLFFKVSRTNLLDSVWHMCHVVPPSLCQRILTTIIIPYRCWHSPGLPILCCREYPVTLEKT